MSFGNHEGPNLVKPEPFFSCMGCKYYSHQMVQSGMNPIYVDNCNHPDILNTSEHRSGPFHGNLGFGSRTPDWCPYLKQENSDGN